ncbi:uncharacterized protein LOC142591437 [Dermacentor variabilis]|uniref:uncharacterized protein LOC142591437 n=1 Tax=Dermacentor variabilis TaxID=34621 RepID=UPI003F5CBA52
MRPQLTFQTLSIKAVAHFPDAYKLPTSSTLPSVPKRTSKLKAVGTGRGVPRPAGSHLRFFLPTCTTSGVDSKPCISYEYEDFDVGNIYDSPHHACCMYSVPFKKTWESMHLHGS